MDAYSGRALRCTLKAIQFSWQMTMLLHRFDGEDSFAAQMRRATLAPLAKSETAHRDLGLELRGPALLTGGSLQRGDQCLRRG